MRKDESRKRYSAILGRRTHIKYQPEDYHWPFSSLPHRFSASVFCRAPGSFYTVRNICTPVDGREGRALLVRSSFFFFFSQSSPEVRRTTPRKPPAKHPESKAYNTVPASTRIQVPWRLFYISGLRNYQWVRRGTAHLHQPFAYRSPVYPYSHEQRHTHPFQSRAVSPTKPYDRVPGIERFYSSRKRVRMRVIYRPPHSRPARWRVPYRVSIRNVQMRTSCRSNVITTFLFFHYFFLSFFFEKRGTYVEWGGGVTGREKTEDDSADSRSLPSCPVYVSISIPFTLFFSHSCFFFTVNVLAAHLPFCSVRLVFSYPQRVELSLVVQPLRCYTDGNMRPTSHRDWRFIIQLCQLIGRAKSREPSPTGERGVRDIMQRDNATREWR